MPAPQLAASWTAADCIRTVASAVRTKPLRAPQAADGHSTQQTVPLADVLRWAGDTDVPVIVMPGVEHFFHGKLPQLKELVVRYYPS